MLVGKAFSLHKLKCVHNRKKSFTNQFDISPPHTTFTGTVQ